MRSQGSVKELKFTLSKFWSDLLARHKSNNKITAERRKIKQLEHYIDGEVIVLRNDRGNIKNGPYTDNTEL